MARKIYLELDDGCLVRSATDRTPVTEIRFHRGDYEDLEIYFVQSYATVDPGTLSTAVLGLKEPGKFEATEFITSTPTWSKSGSGTSAKWTTSLDLRITAINTDLGHLDDGDTSDDVASVCYAADVTWTVAGKVRTIGPVSVVILNDYTKGDEGTGTPEEGAVAGGDLDGSYPEPTVVGIQGRDVVATAPSGNQFYIWNASAEQWQLMGTVTNTKVTIVCPDGVTREIRLITPS